MREEPSDLEALQALLDRSVERAGPFLRASFEMPDRTPSASDLCGRLTGLLTITLATVTAKGEPRVAPIDAVFFRGGFYVPTVAQAARARHLAARPAVSLSYHEGRELAVIIHGIAEALGTDDPAFDELEAIRLGEGGEPMSGWSGDPVFLRIIPDLFYAYAKEM